MKEGRGEILFFLYFVLGYSFLVVLIDLTLNGISIGACPGINRDIERTSLVNIFHTNKITDRRDEYRLEITREIERAN